MMNNFNHDENLKKKSSVQNDIDVQEVAVFVNSLYKMPVCRRLYTKMVFNPITTSYEWSNQGLSEAPDSCA